MQVFKAYILIIKRNIIQIMVFMTIFISLSIAFANMGVGEVKTGFTQSKPNIALFIEDDSQITNGFTEYIKTKTNLKGIKKSEDSINDALFFHDVTYIITVPKGFGESLSTNNPLKLIVRSVPDSYDGTYVNNLINDYFQFVQGYKKFIPKINDETVNEYVKDDLKLQAEVILTSKVKPQNSKVSNSIYFFNYFAYSLFAIIIHGVSSFMISFNNLDIRRRNEASPINPRSMNFQLVSANMLFALCVWAIMFSFAFLIFGKEFFDNLALYYGINTLVYLIVCVAISFLVGSLIKGKGAQAAVVNILSLGLSFLTGVFVPQEFLSKTALKIGAFTPTYWFVLANRKINAAGLGVKLFGGIITKELFVQILFACVIFSVAIIIRRRKNAVA